MIKSVIWSSMVDYPNQICTTLFFNGCNFNCEFCYNKNLWKEKTIDFRKEILPKLLERKKFINHIILSGGECTISSDFVSIVEILTHYGFKIGIHTNGYMPDVLRSVINKLDFIGMDVKNDFENYNKIAGKKVDYRKIQESIGLIIESGVEYEFRTTVYPKYVNMENVLKIVRYLRDMGSNGYVLQNYYDVNGKIRPYSKEKLNEMRSACEAYLPTKIRGIT